MFKMVMEFKLYLYGIEIRLIKDVDVTELSSNCTFMELKLLHQ